MVVLVMLRVLARGGRRRAPQSRVGAASGVVALPGSGALQGQLMVLLQNALSPLG